MSWSCKVIGAICLICLASVVQTLDGAIHRINHYPADKYYGNQLRYPVDSYLSCGERYPTFEQPGPVVENLDFCLIGIPPAHELGFD